MVTTENLGATHIYNLHPEELAPLIKALKHHRVFTPRLPPLLIAPHPSASASMSSVSTQTELDTFTQSDLAVSTPSMRDVGTQIERATPTIHEASSWLLDHATDGLRHMLSQQVVEPVEGWRGQFKTLGMCIGVRISSQQLTIDAVPSSILSLGSLLAPSPVIFPVASLPRSDSSVTRHPSPLPVKLSVESSAPAATP